MPCDNCSCGAEGAKCGSSSKGASVALPPRSGGTARSSVWSTTTAVNESTPLIKSDDGAGGAHRQVSTACEAHHGGRGVCCRDLNKSAERHLLSPDLVRDCIIGLSDGLTVPFALTAGLSGIGSSKIVVIAGLAELVSGAISMGVGGLLSAQAEIQHYNYQKRATFERVRRSCAGEMEREVVSILAPFGISAEIATQVAAKLQAVEADEAPVTDLIDELPPPAAAAVRSDGLVGPSRGLTPFLLRLGEGFEEVSDERVWQSAITIGASYFFGGVVPLTPYLLTDSVKEGLYWSCGITGIILLLFGVAKQRFTGGDSSAKGLLYGAVSMLLTGGAAAFASFMIVGALEGGGK